MENTHAAVWDGLVVNARLATLAGDAGYGLVEDGALGWKDGRITYAGPRSRLPEAARAAEVVDADGRLTGLVTPETIGEMLMVREAMPEGGRLGPWSRQAGA